MNERINRGINSFIFKILRITKCTTSNLIRNGVCHHFTSLFTCITCTLPSKTFCKTNLYRMSYDDATSKPSNSSVILLSSTCQLPPRNPHFGKNRYFENSRFLCRYSGFPCFLNRRCRGCLIRRFRLYLISNKR